MAQIQQRGGNVQQGGNAVNLSSSGAISTQPGTIIGYHVNSTSGGTLVFKDGGSGGTVLNAATTPVQGFNAFPAEISGAAGAYLTISGTIDVTVFFTPG